MAVINISLDAEFKKAIRDEAKRRKYSTASEFIRDQMRFCLSQNIKTRISKKAEIVHIASIGTN